MIAISVISPFLNGAVTVEDNLTTVSQQTSAAEHIVIDGCSTDGTAEAFKRHSADNIQFISEPDLGPYDAMNKGIRLAKGEIIGILNADDFYPEPDVLETVARTMDRTGADSCYGDLEYVDRADEEKVTRRWRAGPYDPNSWFRGWMPPHPTFFVRRGIYEKLGFYRLDMGTSADYELMLRFLFKHGISTVYIPRVLVRMRAGGLSNRSLRNRIRANLMDRKAWKVNGLRPRPWTLWMKPLSKAGQFFT